MSVSDRAQPLIFLIAGEPSGDALGAGLMVALKARGVVSFAGIGGPLMAAQGLTSLFPMKELTVMGLAEVLPLIPALLRRISGTVAEIRVLGPAALVTIDSPGFNFRVARRLKGAGIPLVHYVAPTVWAWKPGRARKIAKFLDHLLAILPFEPPYFEAVGLPCTFVGHPVLESGAGDGDGPGFRRRHGIAPEAPLIVALPGSRGSETGQLLPIFGQALALLEGRYPGLGAVVPTTEALREEVEAAVRNWPVPGLVPRRGKFDAFAAADAALAASGTVSLELAMARTPAVIAYKMNPLSAFLAKRLVRVEFASLVNLILDRQAVPEFIQENCRPEPLADALDGLLGDEEARLAQARAAGDVLGRLGQDGPSPSYRAAGVVLDLIGN